jgi:radical SAM superfamily enzyme YgiQ (UPF0313 family)
VLFEDNFNYLSKMCLLRMREAAFAMIGMARRGGSTVIAAGSDASDHAEEYLARGADFVVVGEGEATLAELMARLTGRTDTPLERISGLAFRDTAAGSRVIRTTPRTVLADLDALPFPAWDLIDVPRYREIWIKRHGYFSMNMVTTRGARTTATGAPSRSGVSVTTPAPRERRGRARMAQADLQTRSHLVRRRHPRPQARLDPALRRSRRA